MAQTLRGGLLDDLARVRELATRPAKTAAEIARNIEAASGQIRLATPHDYEAGHVQGAIPALMQGLFDLRLAVRAALAGWKSQGLLTPDVQAAVRDLMRMARYGCDYLGEMSIGNRRLGHGETPGPAFTGHPLQTFRNPALNPGEAIAWRSGDVIMMRGSHHNSAAIARIGDVDSQFSHLAVLYIDPTGGQHIVESLIEEGAIINPLSHSLGHGVARAALYRHKDERLAAEAARLMHEHVRRSREPGGKRILYDFTMRLPGYRQLFCAKVIRQAFDLASAGKIMLPTYPTRFQLKNRDFLKRIGVKTNETFAPADIDLETDFDLVAEWQDYRATARLRTQDLIMDKLFEWMDEHGYTFKEDFIIHLISFLGRIAGQMSDRAKSLIADVVPKVPSNMRRRTIATVAMLHKTAQPLLEKLETLEAEHLARSGRPLDGRAVYEALEAIRAQSRGRIGYLSGKT
ncbi:MAG: hypothetical protein F9K44_08715 [Hyphomicrobiaceae bacterium]|nr:MAG: hypothetical protein F9K44_08715 [Hyphomicrobiaceae bacterium]